MASKMLLKVVSVLSIFTALAPIFLLVFLEQSDTLTDYTPAGLEDCPEQPPNLWGTLNVSESSLPLEEILKENPKIQLGGYYKPDNCLPRHGATAVVIPYRDRGKQLSIFLNHLHPILQRQQLEYAIIVVEQYGNSTFNRALLLNIGFIQSNRLGVNFTCFIFHDVDLLTEDDRALYTCNDTVVHLSGYLRERHYKIQYEGILGGATAVPKQYFELINGYSNMYFGWGAEDDDFRVRFRKMNVTIKRYPKEINKFRMLPHVKEPSNHPKDNKARKIKLFERAAARMNRDGLNSIRYKVRSFDKFPTHTRVLAEFSESLYFFNKKD